MSASASPPTDNKPPDSSSVPFLAAASLLSTFTSFLTIAIHALLYHRNLYPSVSFLTARAFSLSVHQSRSPAVCTWINDAIAAIEIQLNAGTVRRIVLVVHGSDGGKVRERWVFDVERFPAWGIKNEAAVDAAAAVDPDDPTSNQEEEKEGEEEDEVELSGEEVDSEESGDEEIAIAVHEALHWHDIHQALRGALEKLAYAAQAAEKLPPGCTFTLALELRGKAEAPTADPQPWIPSQPSLQPPTTRKRRQGESLKGIATRPVRSVRAEPLFFECWLEQGSLEPAVVNKSKPSSRGGIVQSTVRRQKSAKRKKVKIQV
ncbi:DNA-binding protein [Trichoderma austrokoningii]